MFEYIKAANITDEFSDEMGRYSLAALLKQENTKKQTALLTGKLITLFDEPNTTSSDINKLYTYYIRTELNGKGKSIAPIIISCREKGISIFAPRVFSGMGAMLGLVNKVRSTIPTGYEMKFRNEKISADIIMGVENGTSYYETVYSRK